jgi:vacuolar-type H+-ATPase subunit H
VLGALTLFRTPAGTFRGASCLTRYPARPYAPSVSVLQDDEGSFAAGRQALLEALTSLEQRAHDRAERMVRDAERSARQLALESEQRAYQLTAEAEERARGMIADADQRAKQVTLEAAQRLAELEQQLSEVRDNLEAARVTLEQQVVSVRGQVEVARASLNTVREKLTTAGGGRVPEAQPRNNPLPRVTIAPLSSEAPPARLEEVAGPSLNDLRAAVDALKKPRRPELASEQPAEPTLHAAEPDRTAAEPGRTPAEPGEPPQPADESADAARR